VKTFSFSFLFFAPFREEEGPFARSIPFRLSARRLVGPRLPFFLDIHHFVVEIFLSVPLLFSSAMSPVGSLVPYFHMTFSLYFVLGCPASLFYAFFWSPLWSSVFADTL